MVSFIISLVALVLGYLLYGKFVTHCTACFPSNQCWVIFTKDNIRYYELYTVKIIN